VGIDVLLVNAIDRLPLEVMLDRYGLAFVLAAPEEVIPGSYWGEREAGLMGSRSSPGSTRRCIRCCTGRAISSACRPSGRAGLDTDAGGDDAEENAVCYLQILIGGRAAECRERADVPRYG